MRNPHTTYRSFTLIEIVLYSALAATILAAASLFLFHTLLVSQKQRTISEVDEQIHSALIEIHRAVENSSAITAPLAQANGTSLTLSSSIPAKNPTVFSLSGGTLFMAEGASAALPLTSARVRVDALRFSVVSRPSTKGSVVVLLRASYRAPSDAIEYRYTREYRTAASVRQP